MEDTTNLLTDGTTNRDTTETEYALHCADLITTDEWISSPYPHNLEATRREARDLMDNLNNIKVAVIERTVTRSRWFTRPGSAIPKKD